MGVGEVTPMLEAYNVSALARMMDSLRLRRDDGLRKAAMVGQLASFLGGSAHLSIVRRRLSPRQWRTLAYSRLREVPVPLTALIVRLRAQGASASEAASELEGLLTNGCLVFVEQQTVKERLDATFANLIDGRYSDLRVVSFPSLLDLAAEESSGFDAIGWNAAAPASARSASFVDVQKDLYLALRAVEDGQIRLTTRGIPFRADVARIAVGANGPAAKSKGSRRRPSDVGPSPRLWFVLSALVTSDLVAVRDGRLVPNAEVQAFLQAPPHEQARRLYGEWLDCVFSELFRITTLDLTYTVDPDLAWVDPGAEAYGVSDIPTWARLRKARRAIVGAIKEGSVRRAGEWLSLDALFSTVQADDPDFLAPRRAQPYSYSTFAYGGARRVRFYEGIRRAGRSYPENQLRRDEDWREVEGAYIAQVVAEPLFWMGLCDRGETATGELTSFRLTPLGRHVILGEAAPEDSRPAEGAPALIVQPNFDLIVLDAFGNLGLLARLDDFAERSTLDRAATYRLQRDSVVRGLARGHTGASILSILETASRASVPQNVRYSVEEWSRLYERIHLRNEATVLLADSPAQLQEWLAASSLAGLLGRQLSPTAVLVPSQHRDTVESILTEGGKPLRSVDYAEPARLLFKFGEATRLELTDRGHDPYVRYRLGAFSENVADEGQPAVFAITAESIKRGLSAGLDPEDMIGYLRAGAVGEVPSDAILRIRGWSGVFAPLRYRAAVAVDAPPGLTWNDLRGVPEVRAAIQRSLGPSIALFRPDRFDAMRAALAERGLRFETSRPERPAEPRTRAGRLEPHLGAGGRARARRDPDGHRAERSESVSLRVLPLVALRAFLEAAAQRRLRVLIGLTASDGSPVGLPFRPSRVRSDEGVESVEGYCEECRELHVVALTDILGVAHADA